MSGPPPNQSDPLTQPDLHPGVIALADVLWAAHERYTAASLINAIAAGTEIRGLLRVELGQLRRSDLCRRLNLAATIDALLDKWHGSDTVLRRNA